MSRRILLWLVSVLLLSSTARCELIYDLFPFSQQGTTVQAAIAVEHDPADPEDFTFDVGTADILFWEAEVSGGFSASFGVPGAIVSDRLIATDEGLFLPNEDPGQEFTLADLSGLEALVLNWSTADTIAPVWTFAGAYDPEDESILQWASTLSGAVQIGTLRPTEHVNEPMAIVLLVVGGIGVVLIRK